MIKNKRVKLKLIVFSVILALGVCMAFQSNISKVHAADQIEDLTKEIKQSGSQGSSYHVYNDLSDKLKKIVPPSNAEKSFEREDAYPISQLGIQCTWYAYHRAKQMGRTYGKFEGNGGDWAKAAGDQPSTVGKPNVFVPQEAISIPGTGEMLTTVSPYGHVAYIEYIDKKGNMLLSEGNVQNKATNNYENWRVVTPNTPGLKGCSGVVAANMKDIKDWGKNPDGSTGFSGTKTDNKDENTSKASDAGTTTSTGTADDTFTVNGYGTINGKAWNENDVSANLPSASDIASLTSTQKQDLADWVAEYNTTIDGTILSTIRTVMQVAAFMLVMFTILILLAYMFDRVGVFDVSVISLLTNGKMFTVYDSKDENFLNKNMTGQRGIGLKSIIVIILLSLTVSILIFSGQMYYITYNLYTYTHDFVLWVNDIRLK